MSEWKPTRLGDLLGVEHGFAFKGEYFDTRTGDVLLTPKNFKSSGGLDVSDQRCKYYVGPVDERFVLHAGDVVVAMTDLKQDAPILGSTGVIPAGRRYLHNQRIGKVVIHTPDRLEPSFVPWLLNSPTVRERVRATATGATVRHTAPSRIASICTLLPSRTLQARIAAVLSAFDELIEINERRIELLEDLARSLYREWFVHFRFPGHDEAQSVESVLGSIPRGWHISTLSNLADITMGQSPRSEFYNEDGIGVPFHQGVSGFDRLLPNHSKYCTADMRTAERHDVLCSVRAPVGRLNIAGDRLGLGRGLSSIRRHDGSQAFLLLQLRQALGAENSIGGGTIYKAIGKTQLAELPTLEPAPRWVKEFESIARPMLDLRMDLTSLNRQLAATRDLLLPRLVTGKLDISDIDLGVLTPTET